MTEDPESLVPLTPVVFHTLVSLFEGSRHGYAIAREVEERTDGRVLMGPGTLYGTLQRMRDAGLIEECDPDDEPGDPDGRRRRYYRMTTRGGEALEAEARRLADDVRFLRSRRILPTRSEES